MSDAEDQVRRMLAHRAERVHSDLSGPRLRALADEHASRPRYASTLTAAAVVLIALLGLFLAPLSSGRRQAPATTTITHSTAVPTPLTRPTTTPRPTPTPTPARGRRVTRATR
jgi:hypothetical protein